MATKIPLFMEIVFILVPLAVGLCIFFMYSSVFLSIMVVAVPYFLILLFIICSIFSTGILYAHKYCY